MRTSPLRRRVGLLAATPLLLVSLAACGGDNSTKATDPGATTTASSDVTQQATEEETVAPGEEVDEAAFLDRIKTGVENTGTAHVSMDMTGGIVEMNTQGDIDYSTNPPTMKMTVSMGGQAGNQTMDMIMVDGVMYMGMGELSGGKYIKMDVNDPNSPLGEQGLGSMDPAEQFQKLADGVDKVVYQGEEKVDGDSTGHYVLTVNTAKLTDLTEAGQSVELPKTLEYDVWLDSENRMRQMQIDMGKEVGSMTMTMSDFGKAVKIAAPPAAKVTEMPTTAGN